MSVISPAGCPLRGWPDWPGDVQRATFLLHGDNCNDFTSSEIQSEENGWLHHEYTYFLGANDNRIRAGISELKKIIFAVTGGF